VTNQQVYKTYFSGFNTVDYLYYSLAENEADPELVVNQWVSLEAQVKDDRTIITSPDYSDGYVRNNDDFLIFMGAGNR